MEKKPVLIGSIIVLLIILILAAFDLGPFDDGEQAVLPSDGIDSNLVVFWSATGRTLKTEELIKDLKKDIPGGDENGTITKITLHRADGRVFVSDPEGKEIEPCGAVIDGRIVGVTFKDGEVIPGGDAQCKRIIDRANIKGLSTSITIRASGSGECSTTARGGYLIEDCP